MTQRSLKRSRETVSDMWQRHPITVGLALLAAGVATGMMLPATAREGGMMGRAARNVTRRVRSSGEELLEKGRELVETSAEVVTREARRQGLTADDIGRKVKRVATRARDSLTS